MTLTYGFLKACVTDTPTTQGTDKPAQHETQYHAPTKLRTKEIVGVRFSIFAISLFLSGAAAAQQSCVAPTSLSDTAYDVKPENEKDACLRKQVKKAPDFNMLVFSWSPGFCKSQKGANNKIPEHLKFQCEENKFGWVVHGLWAELINPETCVSDPVRPDKTTPLHPRYCGGDMPQLPETLVRANMCMMPGSSLIQGEWEKHGACIFKEPDAYFAKINELRAQLILPESNMPQSQLFAWMREHNPILKGISLDYNPKGNELHVCYSTAWKPIDCPGKPTAPVPSLKKVPGANI
ncbi:ribonuclease [Massilia sp. NEAU-DD11]|uniref:Ribonuclease n=1 Tax=Massilia cellulosiltytica TaxID=2683234 RepID=A0A7X3G5W9_9BURK|nr:ribonuclease [Telluria cellulosilytica]MVW64223.1 ribonuclease [Telluria cellulosilytica]